MINFKDTNLTKKHKDKRMGSDNNKMDSTNEKHEETSGEKNERKLFNEKYAKTLAETKRVYDINEFLSSKKSEKFKNDCFGNAITIIVNSDEKDYNEIKNDIFGALAHVRIHNEYKSLYFSNKLFDRIFFDPKNAPTSSMNFTTDELYSVKTKIKPVSNFNKTSQTVGIENKFNMLLNGTLECIFSIDVSGGGCGSNYQLTFYPKYHKIF
jgi:hypothetical protein